MRRFIKLMIFGAAFVLGAGGYAQPQQPAGSVETQSIDANERRITDQIDRAIEVLRLTEIYADLPRAVGDAWIPALKEIVAQPDKYIDGDPQIVQRLVLFFDGYRRILEACLKIADELDPVLEADREAIIRDIAANLVQSPPEEMAMMDQLVRSEFARKAGNTLYAFSLLLTDVTKEEMLGGREATELLQDLFNAYPSEGINPHQDQPPPPAERVARAEIVIADFVRVSDLDNMMAALAHMSDELPIEIGGFKPKKWLDMDTYINQKDKARAIWPSVLAHRMDDERLETIHKEILSPGMRKQCGQLQNLVKEITSITKQDLEEVAPIFQRSITLKTLSFSVSPVIYKWSSNLQNKISPETIAEFKDSVAQMEKSLDFKSPLVSKPR